MENNTNIIKHIASLPFLKYGIFHFEQASMDTHPLMSHLRKLKSSQVT